MPENQYQLHILCNLTGLNLLKYFYPNFRTRLIQLISSFKTLWRFYIFVPARLCANSPVRIPGHWISQIKAFYRVTISFSSRRPGSLKVSYPSSSITNQMSRRFPATGSCFQGDNSTLGQHRQLSPVYILFVAGVPGVYPGFYYFFD